MALGFNYSTGGGDNGDIVPFVKYDARAGRFFRNDRSEQNGAYTNNAVDITSNFKAVMDLENLEVGYCCSLPARRRSSCWSSWAIRCRTSRPTPSGSRACAS
jgi:hypothetical protein